MKKTLLTMGIGAGLMYLLDPQHGGRRRAQLLEKLQGVMPKTAEAVSSKMNALESRASDLTNDLTSRADDIAAEAVTTLPPQLDNGPTTPAEADTPATSSDAPVVSDPEQAS